MVERRKACKKYFSVFVCNFESTFPRPDPLKLSPENVMATPRFQREAGAKKCFAKNCCEKMLEEEEVDDEEEGTGRQPNSITIHLRLLRACEQIALISAESVHPTKT